MKKLIIGFAIAAAVLVPLSAALAQESPDPLAPATGTGSGAPRPAVVLDNALDKLVADGTLTDAQATAVRDAVREEAFGHGPPRRELIARAFNVSADTLGMPVDTLVQRVRDGESVADVATASGIDPQTVIDALVAAGNTAVDQAVANGRLTEQAAAMIKERIPEGAARFVNFTPPGALGD